MNMVLCKKLLTPSGHINEISDSILKETKISNLWLEKCDITFCVYITLDYVQNIFKDLFL